MTSDLPMYTQRTVLNIEPDPVKRIRRSQMLKPYGFRVLEAGDLRTTLAIADGERPDVVVSGLRLPDGTGGSVCRQMRALLPPVPVILIADDPDAATYPGACEYLAEPLPALDLLEAVYRHIP